MIRVNLLPGEKRKAERTPLPQFALIVTNVVAVLGFLIWGAFLFLWISAVKEEITALNAKIVDLQPKVDEFTKLDTQHKALKAKIDELKGVLTRTPKKGYWHTIDSLWMVIHQNRRVWVDNITLMREQSIRAAITKSALDIPPPPPPYGIQMRCHVAGREVSEMTKFRNALKEDPILQQTLYFVNRDVQWSITDEKLFNDHSLSFQVTLFAPNVEPELRIEGATEEDGKEGEEKKEGEGEVKKEGAEPAPAADPGAATPGAPQ